MSQFLHYNKTAEKNILLYVIIEKLLKNEMGKSRLFGGNKLVEDKKLPMFMLKKCLFESLRNNLNYGFICLMNNNIKFSWHNIFIKI